MFARSREKLAMPREILTRNAVDVNYACDDELFLLEREPS